MANASAVSSPLKAGAARVDLTPVLGTQIAGDIGSYRPAELVVDPIYGNALVLEAGGMRLCILSLDLCVVTEPWVREIRELAQKRFGLAPEQVLIHAVQNHAAPSLGNEIFPEPCAAVTDELWWLRGDERYHPVAVERIGQAIGQAIAALTPVSYGAASGFEARAAENRRYVMRDGKAITHPSGEKLKRVLYCEGPIDPEVGVVAFTTDSLQIVAALLHYTCHPCHGYPQRYISGGWPGAWAREVIGMCGQSCVPLVMNGFCGNIHHGHHLDPSYTDTPANFGQMLAGATSPLLKEIRFRKETVLDYRVTRLRLPLRTLREDELAAARAIYEKHPTPMWLDDAHTSIAWDWVYALATLDLHKACQKQPWYDYEIQAFRIGEIALLAAPGEPFVQGQLEIKQGSPVRYTYLAHMSNGCAGYIPTQEAFQRGGYETRTANWSKLQPDALETISREAVGVLKNLFQ